MARKGRFVVVDRKEPFTAWFFFRKDSQKAADALLEELRAKGRMSEKEMSRFVKKLEAGELGFRFSKNNFYRKVLRTFIEDGFVKKEAVYGGEKGRTVDVYLPVRQPILTHPPDFPSFWSVTYGVCLWWNEMMFPQDEVDNQQEGHRV